MKLTFLGTGTSIGVPALGCQCPVCRSSEPKDKRLRASALVETEGGLRVLIDCGPDFRQQIIGYPLQRFDAVLLTHIHYDHVAGLDDLRPFCLFGDVDIYAQQDVIDALHQTMPYCFKKDLYPGVPHLRLHEAVTHQPITISRPKDIYGEMPASGSTLEGEILKTPTPLHAPATSDEVQITPIRVMHGSLPILGYRIGSLAYLTDMKDIGEEELAYLKGIDTLVLGALRFVKPHHSHQRIEEGIEFAKKIGARSTYFTHLTHDIGTHDAAQARLEQGFYIAYDGLQITF